MTKLVDVERFTVTDDGDLELTMSDHEIVSKDGFVEGEKVALIDTGRGLEIVPRSELEL